MYSEGKCANYRQEVQTPARVLVQLVSNVFYISRTLASFVLNVFYISRKLASFLDTGSSDTGNRASRFDQVGRLGGRFGSHLISSIVV